MEGWEGAAGAGLEGQRRQSGGIGMPNITGQHLIWTTIQMPMLKRILMVDAFACGASVGFMNGQMFKKLSPCKSKNEESPSNYFPGRK